jgi:glycerophosphoryl diester phosphodiesterase
MSGSLAAWPYPQMCAHRGAGKHAPENTLVAIRFGASYGYRMMEFDVKLSADNVLFLLHDDTVNRTSNGVGDAAKMGWAALAQLDAGAWHSHAFAGEPMPTFANVITFCQANGVAMNVEIKPCPGRERETGAAVAKLVHERCGAMSPPPLLSSFSEEALEAAREVAQALPRALLLDQLPADWLARCKRLGCVAVDCNWRLLTKGIVDEANAAGLNVLCYTCNDTDAVANLVEMGVNTIITDAILTISP